jgi:hypothetical protein
MWGKHTWIIYRSTERKIKEVSFGRTYKRSNGPVVDRWRDEDIEGWWCRAKDEFDQVINQATSYIIHNCIKGAT